jgi:hypothetical protein
MATKTADMNRVTTIKMGSEKTVSSPATAKTAPPITVTTSRRPTHDEIARCAYSLWKSKGCPQGQDLHFWLEAERQLLKSKGGYK